MLGDEAAQKAIRLSYQGSKLTAKVIDSLIRDYLNKKNQPVKGEQSLKSLNKSGQQLENITVSARDLIAFKREFKRYGIDFAVMRNKKNNTYEIFFKGKDINQIKHVLENYLAKTLEKNATKKPSIRDRMNEAAKKAQEFNKQRQQQQDRNFTRGRDER